MGTSWRTLGPRSCATGSAHIYETVWDSTLGTQESSWTYRLLYEYVIVSETAVSADATRP